VLLHDIAVDGLDHGDTSAVGDDIKGLGLDVGAADDFPGEMVSGQFGEGGVFGLLGDGVDCLGAIVVVGDADTVEEKKTD
jgi:hypothetical protein